ncbi:cell wall protein IFF6 [Strongylocentrotus purpuratus]|uniref:Uncharacterized protein n=1 Tax=Strongylocentrotus purpuratus TaxID=7668 RepID=A0A7M7GGK0_STRPU|nr:cell wall protein IFF6 [Strongylocentrotus purpuratus]
MAPFLLALIIFGVSARTNALPYPGDIPGDDEDGYNVGIPFSEVCHRAFTDNEPKYDIGFVNYMVDSICPFVSDNGEKGSGKGSVYWSGYGLQILTIENIVEALSPDPGDRQILRGLAESACKSEVQGHMGIDSFCRFRRDGIKVSGMEDGGGAGSGAGSGDRSGAGSGAGSGDSSGAGSGDGSDDSSVDDGYGFSFYWSSIVDERDW